VCASGITGAAADEAAAAAPADAAEVACVPLAAAAAVCALEGEVGGEWEGGTGSEAGMDDDEPAAVAELLHERGAAGTVGEGCADRAATETELAL
jgi:hypothetical protein